MKYLLKLYITGDSPRSQRAIANLMRICDRELPNQYELTIIDVLEQPDVAKNDNIMVTPTLVKQLPPPLQKLIGDMSKADLVLLGLDIDNQESPKI